MSKNMLNKIVAVFISVVMMICIIPTDVLALGVESESTSLISTGNVLSEEEGSEPSDAGEQETVITEDPGTNENEKTSIEPETYNAKAVDENSYEAVTLGVNTINDLDSLVSIAGQIADTTVTVDSDNKQIKVNANGLILLSNVDYDFTGYTVYLITLSGGDADLTERITVDNVTYTYQGLGTDTIPFSGTLEAQDGSYGAILNVPFFKNVNASKVHFSNLSILKLKQKGNSTTAMLAANVSGTSEEAWKSLNIEVGKESVTDGGTTTDYLPTALIDTMAENASLSLGTITYTDGATVSAANAGLLCNTMNENSSLEVSTLTVNGTVSITATSGDAGGFVGLMNVGASLSVNAGDGASSVTIGSNFTITGQNTGGLIGSGENIKLNGTQVIVDGATVKGSASVGGLIGNYIIGEVESGFTSYNGLDT